MKWRVVFEVSDGPAQSYVVGGGDTAQALRVADAFRKLMHKAFVSRECRSFVVGVHPDGPDCGHEVPA